MLSRSISGAALALVLLTGGASAAERGGLFGGFSLPGIFGSKNAGQPTAEPAPAQGGAVRMAQAGDPRITQLQEQMRQLSGTIEELNFQILQMQEQMRKQQEDIEFRLQEIEGSGDGAKKQGSAAPAGGKSDRRAASAAPDGDAPSATAADDAPAAEPGAGDAGSIATLGDATLGDTTLGGVRPGGSAGAPAAGAGTSSQPLGTITFDAAGNVTGGSVGDQTVVSPGADIPADIPADGTAVAALPQSDNPEELYSNSYEFILSGDYKTAEAGFRDHVARFPKDARAADAQFWLGESLLGQDKYREAAEVFLAANKSYPKSRKAPDMLFKLGVSLAGLNQRDVACATFGEVEKRYPTMSEALKKRVKQEKTATSC